MTLNALPLDNKAIRLRNLEVLIKQYGRLAVIAERVGTDPNYLSSLRSSSSKRGLGNDLARRIEVAFGLPRGWMDMLHDQTPYTPYASSGDEAPVLSSGLEPLGELFAEAFNIGAHLRIMRVTNDAMAPTIKQGDSVVLNIDTKDVSGDGFYVFEAARTTFVRRVQYTADENFLLIPDNPIYHQEQFTREQLSNLKIAGKVMWVCKRV